MKTILQAAAAVFLLCAWAGPGLAADYYDSTAPAVNAGDQPVILYGRVVDQHGRPVYRARVTSGRQYLNTGSLRFFGIEAIKAETDADGRFICTGQRIKTLYIKAIEKRGYEPLENEKGIKTFSYDPAGPGPIFKPDPARPVVFVLQKKFDAGLVDNKKARMLIRPGAEGFTVDLFKGFSGSLEKISARQAGRDIVVRLYPARGKQPPIMEISAPGAKNGLADKAGKPHIAPARGYKPALFYQVLQAGRSKVIVYHRGRGGKVYSRLVLELEPVESGIRVMAGLFINIEGLRNTDFDTFYTEEQLVRMTGRKLSYGGSAYRETIAAILYKAIQ